MEEVVDHEEIIERVAALDIGKRGLTCCVRVPGDNGRRRQEVVDYDTMPKSLLWSVSSISDTVIGF